MPAIAWGDVPAWLGAVGALVIGAAAVVISIAQFRIAKQQTEIARQQARIADMQFEHQQFRPMIRAYRDAARRIVVQVVNQGAGSGQVHAVNLMTRANTIRIHKKTWELPAGTPAGTEPVPFLIGGLQTAQLVLIPEAGLDLNGVSVRIDYGDGSDSGLIDPVVVPGRLRGTTQIP